MKFCFQATNEKINAVVIMIKRRWPLKLHNNHMSVSAMYGILQSRAKAQSMDG